MAMTEIRTPRLLLRRARTSDLEAIHAVLSNPQAMRYWWTPPHEDIEQSRDWLVNMIESPRDLSEDFVIERDGRVIGKVGAWRLPDFGYILHPDHWGAGLATEALTAFLGEAFGRPDVSFLTADTDPRNAGSIRLLQKLGFRETGRAERTWHTHLGWCESIYFRLDRPIRSS